MKQVAGKPQMRKDWELERVFREEGPFWHLHTKPLETGVIFENDIDRAVALVYVAIAAKTVGVDILAYALMSNHFHFILPGAKSCAGRSSTWSGRGCPYTFHGMDDPGP